MVWLLVALITFILQMVAVLLLEFRIRPRPWPGCLFYFASH